MSSFYILVVDDDDDLRGILREQLEATHDDEARFVVAEAASCAACLAWLETNSVDTILLDIDLPDGDGRNVCQQLRDRGIHTPIIMLTGMHDEDIIVHSLRAGANDYISKPFRIRELTARILTHIRTHQESKHAVHDIGPYRFFPAKKILQNRDNNKRLRLTEKEADIIRYLLRARGESVHRQELLREVWRFNELVATHTLETHIYRLRQKIEPDPANATLLLTTPGGYRLATQPPKP